LNHRFVVAPKRSQSQDDGKELGITIRFFSIQVLKGILSKLKGEKLSGVEDIPLLKEFFILQRYAGERFFFKFLQLFMIFTIKLCFNIKKYR
jgi:hypothetical protein